ncbi:MAG: class I SAM-dependent methyltransferase [Candidatus Thiodiazotropha sp. (ex Rostrolucina anterorostrata)]|nr:class I SAM-dependent methyltransferase [Candidatus Thiodiazotropha sp. (ex Rostrolucina anterorostrata)]
MQCQCKAPERNPLRGRFNSWLLEKFEEAFHQEVGERKAQLFANLEGSVVEVGPGNGVNFRYYPKDLSVKAIEPNPYMHERLKESAQTHSVDMELISTSAEVLELDDASIDAVICTLVMCTIPNPEVALAEVHRVLKPGGHFIFIEHVAAPKGSGLRITQDLLQRPWRWLFEGCHTNRETARLIEAAGFNKVEYEGFKSKIMPPPILPQIVGVAIK